MSTLLRVRCTTVFSRRKAMKKLPKGLDQQGRYPEAAEAATEIGVDDDAVESLGKLVVLGLCVVVLVGAIAFVVGVLV
jgi:hypothetical protein